MKVTLTEIARKEINTIIKNKKDELDNEQTYLRVGVMGEDSYLKIQMQLRVAVVGVVLQYENIYATN